MVVELVADVVVAVELVADVVVMVELVAVAVVTVAAFVHTTSNPSGYTTCFQLSGQMTSP